MTISQSEQAVMETLWRESPLTVGQIIERLQVDHSWHENTIKTMLSRLADKQCVSRYRDGKRYFYEPAISRESVISDQAAGLLSRFFSGKVAPMVAHFAQNKRLTAKDIAEIRAILDEIDDTDH